jgi:hypothetical protein
MSLRPSIVVNVCVLRASSEFRLRAAAKEGLIRQRAGEKTAVRLAAQLSSVPGARSPAGGAGSRRAHVSGTSVRQEDSWCRKSGGAGEAAGR